MFRTLVISLALMLAATAADATCYADYKAKKDNPLRLHYGVIELSEASCGDRARATDEVRARIGTDGWTLLNVMSVFEADGLNQRRESAADYFLRF